VALHRQAIEVWEEDKIVGEAVWIAQAYKNLGNLLTFLGDFDEAETHKSEALRLLDEEYGPDHGYSAGVYQDLGVHYELKGDPVTALEHWDRCINIESTMYPEAHPFRLYPRLERTDALCKLGRHEEALAEALSVTRILENLSYAEDPRFALKSKWCLGREYMHLGQAEEGKASLTSALEIVRSVWGEDSPRYAYQEASYRALTGASEEALRLLRRSVELGNHPSIPPTDPIMALVGMSPGAPLARFLEVDVDLGPLLGTPGFEEFLTELQAQEESK
jgi:tetratricopeptide (TPR) repeat protein